MERENYCKKEKQFQPEATAHIKANSKDATGNIILNRTKLCAYFIHGMCSNIFLREKLLMVGNRGEYVYECPTEGRRS